MTFLNSPLDDDPLTGLARRATRVGILASALSLAGCYVVPIQPPHTHQGSTVYVPSAQTLPPMPSAPVTFAARLYPSNDIASSYGMVMAVVTNDLNGRGTFSTNINGESFTARPRAWLAPRGTARPTALATGAATSTAATR